MLVSSTQAESGRQPLERHGATVAIAGNTDTSTPNTATVNLSEGANTITVTVTAEDGTTT